MSDSAGGHFDHELMKEALAAAAFDALSDDEMDSVMSHVDQCEPCRTELAALRRYASQLAYAAPMESIKQGGSDRIRMQLLARARADRQPLAVSSGNLSPHRQTDAPASIPSRRKVNWLTAAALAASMVALAVLIRDRRELESNLSSARSQRVAEAAALRSELAERDARLSALIGPQVKVIALAAPTPRPVGGVMFWDQASDQWTFIAHDLPPLGPGRTYQLWLVLESIPTSVGVFAPDALGNARVSASLALDSDARLQVAVTNEPGGGSAQPTGAPVIVGQVSG